MEKFENADGTVSLRVAGKPLPCVVCGHKKYQERKTLLNTRSGEFFNPAWAEKKAQNYICVQCGDIFWFLRSSGDRVTFIRRICTATGQQI